MKEFIKQNKVYHFKDWNKEQVFVHFSTRLGGVSTAPYQHLNLALNVGDNDNDVVCNRQIYADLIGVNLNNFVYANQTHSDRLYEVTHLDKQRGVFTMDTSIDNIDCLYSFEFDVVLNLFYADCTPIYFRSVADNLIGIIHAGWQGSVKEITYKSLDYLIKKHHLDPNNIEVLIGPSISKNSFEVEQDVIDKIPSTLDYSSCYSKKDLTKYNLDVKLMNKIQANA
ncbi:MAG: laccase domain-containing protein, partial [Spiroplasma sp.]|nr:laccase domain-containing protein [Mycoplasmatales bacterium]